jgi:hypothetical protein
MRCSLESRTAVLIERWIIRMNLNAGPSLDLVAWRTRHPKIPSAGKMRSGDTTDAHALLIDEFGGAGILRFKIVPR